MQHSNPSFAKKLMPLFFVFVAVNSLVLWYWPLLEQKKIDALVVFTANCLLFGISAITLAMHTKEIDKKNPNAAIRGVMAATVIKIFVMGIAVVVYLLTAIHKSYNAIFISMGLYFVYTFLEVKAASKNQEKNGGN